MKLSGREATAFTTKPDPAVAAVLLYGPDQGLVAQRRRTLVAATIGEDGSDLSLTEISPADARKDPALVFDTLKARGFFPGKRVVLIQGASDALTKTIAEFLDDLTEDDACLILTAEILPARSSLRKLFEGQRRAIALQFFADPIEPAEIARRLEAKGLSSGLDTDALDLVTGLSSDMDHGSADQFFETIAVYGLDRNSPLRAEDILALAPSSSDEEIDRFVATVADGRPDAVGPALRKLSAAGVQPVAMLIALERHFRMLLAAMTSPAGPESGLVNARPPVWGPRRSAALRQLRQWSASRLEQAAQALFQCDAEVRSASQRPELAAIERCALRLAIMAKK